MLKTSVVESYPRAKLSQSKHLKRSKATSNFLEVNQKCEDDFGSGIGDKNTRIEISKRTKNKNSFSKAKKKGKSTKFLGKFISLPIEISWKLWSKLKTGMRIFWDPFNGSAEGGRKKEGKGQRIFILN